MNKFKACFLEKNKYDYLGTIYFKEDPIIQNFLKELDILIRPKYTPNSYLNVLQLMIDTNVGFSIVSYLQYLRNELLKGFMLEDIKWKFGRFIIDYRSYNWKLSEELENKIEKLVKNTEQLMTKNRIPQG